MSKYFIITVDTEGDNLWNWDGKSEIKTENSLYIPRFQELCEKYGFIPVYLTNYEMALDDRWVEYSSAKAKEGKCEIGIHLHAWNTPPIYELENDPSLLIAAKNKLSNMLKIYTSAFAMEMYSIRLGMPLSLCCMQKRLNLIRSLFKMIHLLNKVHLSYQFFHEMSIIEL